MDRATKGKEPMLSHREPPKRCPRCDSTNTKFCYFNNYNQSQPRHFCRACRRYWTEGGTLRNVPQGGGSHHKAKRVRTQASPSGSRPKVPSITPSSVPPLTLTLPQPLAGFLVGGDGIGEGGMSGSGNFQTFNPGNIRDFMEFQACYDQACCNPSALPMLPGFINMPSYQQMPPLDPSLVIASHQQMNITVFSSTTTMTTDVATTVSAARADDINIGGDVGFWNSNEFSIIQGDDQEGSSPPPPPPQNPSDST